MLAVTRKYEEGIFFPEAWQCLDCKRKIPLDKDNFIPPCCGKGIVCYDCYTKDQQNIKCRLCNTRTLHVRISADFFKNIEDSAWALSSERMGDIECNNRKGSGELALLCEEMELRPGTRAKTLAEDINKMVEEYRHAENCRLYTNMGYLCESLTQIRGREKGRRVTINDILAFMCFHCGHGHVNRKFKAEGGMTGALSHRMYDCSEKCCGEYLDRRYLQFKGGNCECGVLIMQKLGIEPANDRQNEWRRSLYEEGVTSDKVREIWEALGPTLREMNLAKPYMVLWYLVAQGGKFLIELMVMSGNERKATLWSIVRGINAEYGVHRPIQ